LLIIQTTQFNGISLPPPKKKILYFWRVWNFFCLKNNFGKCFQKFSK
jgi:hypothetical protein